MERDRVNDTLRQMKDATMSGGVLTTLCMLGAGGRQIGKSLRGQAMDRERMDMIGKHCNCLS